MIVYIAGLFNVLIYATPYHVMFYGPYISEIMFLPYEILTLKTLNCEFICQFKF